MILNLIKKLYFSRLDEGYTEKQETQIKIASAAIETIASPDWQLVKGATSLEGYKKGPAAQAETGSEEGGEVPDTEAARSYTYVKHAGFEGENKARQVMTDRFWQDSTSQKKDIRNPQNPVWITILDDFLGAEAEDEDGNTDTTQTDLANAGVATEMVRPEDEDPIGRAGVYLFDSKAVSDPKIYERIQKAIKNIVRSIVSRSGVVRSEAVQNGRDLTKGESWAKSDGYAGMRGSGAYPASWEFSLAHVKGIEWPKDDKGRPARHPETNEILGPIEANPTDGTLLKATQAKVFFEKLASGEFKVNQNCARLRSMVSIDESGSNTRIAYAKGGEGIFKIASPPELDAIKRIKERCECKDDNKPGCIDKSKTPFGTLAKFSYDSQVINNYVGKMVESLRVSGLLLRMYKDAKTPAEKTKLFGYAQQVIDQAMSSDAVLHKAGLSRLEAFELAGADVASFADIEDISQLEKLTDGDRQNLYRIIMRLETEDLAARDPDIVLPVGLTVGNGDRKDNMEAHLDPDDARDALINQGIDPKEVHKYIIPTTLDEIALMMSEDDREYVEMYKDVHGITGNTPIYGMGLSLKNQVNDSSTKFGEQTRGAQSDIIRLGDEKLSESQKDFKEKAYKEVGINTPALRIAVSAKQKEHDTIKDTVYGLFPGTEWFMDDEDGMSVKETPGPVAERLIKQIQKDFPFDSELRNELEDLLQKEETTTEDGVGRIREKLTRILTKHKTHKECTDVETKGKNKGKLTKDALIARKHLAASVFFTGGSIDEILASKRGFTSNTVDIYSQNDVIRPMIKGIVDGTWEIKPSSRGEGLTTIIEEPGTGRHVSFTADGEGGGLDRKTRFELIVNKKFTLKHLLKRTKNLFEGNSLDTLLSLMNTQQKLFEKLLTQVQ